jgi:hypothetical protein
MGNVTNTGAGTITAGNQGRTNTGILINTSTVTGTVVNHGSITASTGQGIKASTTYDILDPSSISGKFSGVTVVNAPGFSGTLAYTPTDCS